MVHALGLAFVLASVKDHSDHLLAGGVVSGDVEQVVGGTGLQAAKLVDQGLAVRPGEERADDVCVDDIRELSCIIGRTYGCNPVGTRWAPAGSS